jgi:hypothetical protein
MLETGTIAELEQPEEPKTFSEYQPCDSCRVARAMWKISGDSGTLYLCSHHKNKFEPKLASWGKEFLELSLQ